MTTVPFKEEFATAVEDGSKGQSIRGAECYNKTCDYNGGDTPWCSLEKPDCFLSCSGYTPRYKVGATLQPYTGLMRRKWCKLSNKKAKFGKRCSSSYSLGVPCYDGCGFLGAKLLKTATCTESFPIKFEDLTEEIARLDGFKPKVIGEGLDGEAMWETSLWQLQGFLIKTYDAKDGDVVQVIRWK